MATITVDTYLDAAARTAGEAWTCNGGVLKVRTDSRVHAGAPASMTGSIGAVTVSATLGGGYEIDGTNVRWLAFTGGTGNVPAIGATITGVTSGVTGYLLGVWASLTVAPTAPGAATPATGFIKLRETTGGNYQNAEAIGDGSWSAAANGADVVGWIEVVHDQAVDLTPRRLGLGWKVAGAWFELGTTNGSAGQTFQVPTNGGGADTHVPGVEIETSPGSGVYEQWPALTVATGWSNTYLAADARIKMVESVGDGVVRIGSDGTNNVGFVPASGCKVRIPNVIGRQCATGSRATNALPHTTLGSRPEIIATSAPKIDIDKFMTDWYVNISGAYEISIKSLITETRATVYNCPTKPVVHDLCVGRIVSVANISFQMFFNYNGADIRRITAARHDGASSGYVTSFTNCAGTPIDPFLIDGVRAYASTGAARAASNYSLYGNLLVNAIIKNVTQLSGCVYILNSSGVVVENVDHIDRLIGSTNSTTGIYCVRVENSKDVTVDGATFGLKGVIADVHPYNGVFHTTNNLGGIRIRNLGTKAAPISGGSVERPAYVYISAGGDTDVKVQRCYLDNTRTLPFTAPNSCQGMLFEHVYGTWTQLQTMIAVNGIYRNIGGTNTTTGQTSVYGTHWIDVFTSDTVGRVVLAMNEPTVATAPYITASFGANAGFTSTGQVAMPNLNDEIVIEIPYFILGHTAFQNTAPTLTGTNTNNFTIEYQIDTGSGWNGTWKALSGANLSAESISPSTGFKLKYKITVNTASSTNALTYIRIDTDSTALAQQNNLYPLDVYDAVYEITGLEVGTEVVVYNAGYTAELAREVITGTTFEYNYEWNSDDGDFDVNILVWKDDKQVILMEGIALSFVDQSVPLFQADDLVYMSGRSDSPCTFSGSSKLIIMDSGTIIWNVPEVYSRWKDWLRTSLNAQHPLAFRIVGGDPTSGSKSIPQHTFLTNGWQGRPQEASHTLAVTDGILVATGDPFVDTVGAYTVRINYEQPVQAIEVATGGGGGATPAQIWSYSTRTLTSPSGPTAEEVADAVWEKDTTDPVPGDSYGEKVGNLKSAYAWKRTA